MGTITADRLRDLLHYDPETGKFTRRCGRYAGAVVGTVTADGYLRIMVGGTRDMAHRLAVLYMTGELPREEVDHINGSRADNRWANLRQVSRELNMQNRRTAHTNNATGLLGVTFEPDRRKFKAHIHADGRKRSLGRYATAEEAHAVYLNAKRALHAGCTI